MKHFHGTPYGGTRDQVCKFAVGRFLLVPFANQDDLPVAAEVSRGFALDNSAFTIWKQGGKLDFQGVMDWYSEWSMHPRCDLLIIPDDIEGNEADNDSLLSKFVNKANKNMMDVAAPVWHLHESLERLDRLVQWKYLCLGSSGDYSSPGSKKWTDRMAEAMDVICDDRGRPKTKLHGLRMLAPDIVRRYPFFSADSTNVVQCSSLLGRFGMYKPPTRVQCSEVIASRIEAAQSPSVWVRNEVQQEFNLS